MKYLMFYEMAADGLSKARANLPAHQNRLQEFHQMAPCSWRAPTALRRWVLWESSQLEPQLRSSSLVIHSSLTGSWASTSSTNGPRHSHREPLSTHSPALEDSCR